MLQLKKRIILFLTFHQILYRTKGVSEFTHWKTEESYNFLQGTNEEIIYLKVFISHAPN